MGKEYNLKRIFFIILQALSLVLIVACISVYNFYSTLTIEQGDDSYEINVPLEQYRSDYYNSSIFTDNMTNTVYNITKYAVIKHQLETDGSYDPNKKIYIGQYAHRADNTPYNGPDAAYYLKDLIAWGQFGISTNGISHSYQVFDSWEDLNDFFGQNSVYTMGTYTVTDESDEIDDISGIAEEGADSGVKEYSYAITHEIDEGEELSDSKSKVTVFDYAAEDGNDTQINIDVPMLDVISNRYLSCDGENLEYYAADSYDYEQLVANLEKSATELYTNYRYYLEYTEKYDPDNSNIRFYLRTGKNGGDIHTNLLNYRLLDDDKLNETFKSMGSYIFACPGDIEYLTDTLVEYEDVKEAIINYSYYLPDDTVLWVGLDTTYPVKDIFSINYSNISTAVRIVPFIISFAVIGLLSFIALFVIIPIRGKNRIKELGSRIKIQFYDRMPIETEILIILFFGVVIYFMTMSIFGNIVWDYEKPLKDIVFNECVTVFLYAFVALSFFYHILRRIYLHTLFESSILVGFAKWFDTHCSFIKKFFWKTYDSAGIAIRTWALYLCFLIFNTFWACMLFFSKYTVISFLVLLLFDGACGILLFNRNVERKRIFDTINRINEGEFNAKVETSKMHGDNKTFAETVNNVGDSIRKAVETSSKDEKLKADLITNVSHDIKTPLTSIINYVDLIKRENIDNERVNNYIRILDEKSQRLKQLTVDLVEASKITSGNITLEISRINMQELIYQAQGEFEEKYDSRGLTLILSLPDKPVLVDADPRYLWRVIENLMQNAYKYALQDTRVYLDLTINEENNTMSLSLKNISDRQLNINADELTERFIRGDVARNSEGSGLGLSIVKSLVKAHNGIFDIYLDGDLFKATVTLPTPETDAEEKN